ncbi:hypothetical protein BC827DRAFT_1202825 [Russula dissimulans]|nr:hypothetical protein BC827DRAFT_1202825 [Russula dissimulans]
MENCGARFLSDIIPIEPHSVVGARSFVPRPYGGPQVSRIVCPQTHLIVLARWISLTASLDLAYLAKVYANHINQGTLSENVLAFRGTKRLDADLALIVMVVVERLLAVYDGASCWKAGSRSTSKTLDSRVASRPPLDPKSSCTLRMTAH